MSKKRLFIAINLPEEVRERLKEFQEKWREFPARWVKPGNIHLTLYFLGYMKEENIQAIIKITEKAIGESRPFSVIIKDIVYGPDGEKPRMIWARIENNPKLIELQRQISRELRELPFPVHQESHPFSTHLTICRFNSFDFKNWSQSELPDIQSEIQETFTVSSIEIMESKLKRGGAEYSVIKSIKL